MNTMLIRELIDSVYADVGDPLLGRLFERVIGPDWTEHLERIREFWNTVAPGTRSSRGKVFGKNMAIEGVEPEMFGRCSRCGKRTPSAC